LFALTALAAGGNAVAEAGMYRAANVDAMSVALKWYVAMAGLWFVATIWFFSLYTRVGTIGRWLAVGLSAVFLAAWVGNFFLPHSFLYSEILGVREISLPWGEQIRLAIGRDNPWRMATELSLLGVLVLVIAGCLSLRREGQPVRAWLIGASTVLFMLMFGTHAFLVDTGRLASPYLSSYGFLAIVLVMSYDLAGEVVRAGTLSTELKKKDADLQVAVAEERNRIASDLHDSVTQTLFSTAAIADALPDVWDRYPDEARRGLEQLRQSTKGALAEMRTLLLELRPSALQDKGLGELITQLVDAAAARTRIPVTADVTCDRELPEDVKTAFYRIAQEALNNVTKHAQATSVRLDLGCDAEQVSLAVGDDGRGFQPQDIPSGRLGLGIMRDRANSIDADLTVETQPGEGTTIRVVWSE
jgi:signal transduction histidine kinase